MLLAPVFRIQTFMTLEKILIKTFSASEHTLPSYIHSVWRNIYFHSLLVNNTKTKVVGIAVQTSSVFC